jgi:hypothetical protein
MAIKLTISNTVQVPVKGKIADEAGRDQPFDFTLTCKRLDAEEIKALLEGGKDVQIADALRDLTIGWKGVVDDDNTPAPYSPDGLAQLLRIPGLAMLSLTSYLKEVGAKEKN